MLKIFKSLASLVFLITFIVVKAIVARAIENFNKVAGNKRPEECFRNDTLFSNESNGKFVTITKTSNNLSNVTNATLQLRLRSSLKKRKEKIILSGSPPGGGSLPCSGYTSPRTPSGSRSTSPVEQQRARTISEQLELEDKVMPLPMIRSKLHRKWKSCGSFPHLTNNSTGIHHHHFHPRHTHRHVLASVRRCTTNNPAAVDANAATHVQTLHKTRPKMGEVEQASRAKAAVRTRHLSADDIEARRRKLMLAKLQRRQLSDPVKYPAHLQRSSSLDSILNEARARQDARNNNNNSQSRATCKMSENVSDTVKNSNFLVEQRLLKCSQRAP